MRLRVITGLKPIKRASFREFVENEYWPYAEEHNKESTVRANSYKMRCLEQFFGDKELNDISDEMVEEYKMWLQEAGFRKITQHNEQLLSAIK